MPETEPPTKPRGHRTPCSSPTCACYRRGLRDSARIIAALAVLTENMTAYMVEHPK